ncbi:MAG: hypothetical protein AAF727_12440 [Pseudomonadota bacterium]
MQAALDTALSYSKNRKMFGGRNLARSAGAARLRRGRQQKHDAGRRIGVPSIQPVLC